MLNKSKDLNVQFVTYAMVTSVWQAKVSWPSVMSERIIVSPFSKSFKTVTTASSKKGKFCY